MFEKMKQALNKVKITTDNRAFNEIIDELTTKWDEMTKEQKDVVINCMVESDSNNNKSGFSDVIT